MSEFVKCFQNSKHIMMEGALGERLKSEYKVTFDENVAMGALVYDEKAGAALRQLWGQYYEVAAKYDVPFIATTPTRRINSERVGLSGYGEHIIRDNISFLKDVKESLCKNMYVGYMLGCKGDAYTGIGCCSAEESYDFHKWEIERAVAESPDFIYAALIPTYDEAAGISKCLGEYNIPYIISFTINEDGCLVDGTPISDTIEKIDSEVDNKPLCYMTNCVHPRIIYKALMKNDIDVINKRFQGIQVNTADYPYAVLESSGQLVYSTPEELAESVKRIDDVFNIKIIGGCCGTNAIYMDRMLGAVTI